MSTRTQNKKGFHRMDRRQCVIMLSLSSFFLLSALFF